MEALQNTAVCFHDPDLKSGDVRRDPVLGPKPISGNFASVFSVTSRAGSRYAVKCFTQDVAAQEARYDAISRHLAKLDPISLSQPWNVGFEYLPQGILVSGERFPILKMEWAEGRGLIHWIESHPANPTAFASLADRFAALVSDLGSAGVAHGDLQHGNLLVAGNGTFRLVDYDGMFVPALVGYRATERGHRNYQSPKRTDDDFGPALDRFSAWVIYLSLTALAIDPSLWGQLHERDSESLLLTEQDFQEPSTSVRFAMLLSHPNHELRDLARHVRDLTSQPLATLPALTPRTPQALTTQSSPPSMSAAATVPTSHVSGSGTTLPNWLAGHLQQTAPMAPATATFSAAPSSGFRNRRPIDVALAAMSATLTVTPTTLMAASILPALFVPDLTISAVLTALLACTVGRRTRSEVRAARGRRRDLRRQHRALGGIARDLKKLDQEAQVLERAERDRDTTDSARVQELQAEQHREAAHITILLNQQIATIDREIAALPQRERERRDRALAPLQRSHIENQLRRASIREAARLSNMGSRTIDALIAAGIRSAADFTQVRYITGGGYSNVTAIFVLASGHQTRVPGVGEKRARTLESWRQSIESRARQAAPSALSPAEERAIGLQTAAESARLRNDRARAEADAQADRDRLRQRIAAQQRLLVDMQTAARTDAAKRRAEFGHRRTQLVWSEGERARLGAALAGERQVLRSLSMRRYLKFLLVGA